MLDPKRKQYEAFNVELIVMSTVQDYSGPHITPVEAERIENLQSYALNNAHYFCETADITRPFPSNHGVLDPSWEFVWNRWLTQPFRDLGLKSHCPHLLQVPPLPPLPPLSVS